MFTPGRVDPGQGIDCNLAQDLQSERGNASAAAAVNWEGRCVLLMWLANLVITPFPISRTEQGSRYHLSPCLYPRTLP